MKIRIIATIFIFTLLIAGSLFVLSKSKPTNHYSVLAMSMISVPCSPDSCDCNPAACGDGGNPDPAGGYDPGDRTTISSSQSAALGYATAPYATCGIYSPQTKAIPITWQWYTNTTLHLQVYDSKGTWWFNNWLHSNSYTVFSKNDQGKLLGVPADGRTTYARVSYDGAHFSPVGEVNCSGGK